MNRNVNQTGIWSEIGFYEALVIAVERSRDAWPRTLNAERPLHVLSLQLSLRRLLRRENVIHVKEQ